VQAQDPVYAQLCAELAAGKKVSYWMWFVFPQMLGLVSCTMAIRIALASIDQLSRVLVLSARRQRRFDRAAVH